MRILPDKDAFRHHLNAPAGEHTQAKLQELEVSDNLPEYGPVKMEGEIFPLDAKASPITVKIEKENCSPGE